MSEPFLAEIKPFAFNFAPRGWAGCDGQILPINQNQSLYSLLGTTYGGDGRTSFGLPDLRGRAPVHTDDGVRLGQKGGAESVTLTSAQTPSHTHAAQATESVQSGADATGALLAVTSGGRRPTVPYGSSTSSLVPLQAGSIGNTGGNSHDNMQPYQALNFCIAIQGVFPSRN